MSTEANRTQRSADRALRVALRAVLLATIALSGIPRAIAIDVLTPATTLSDTSPGAVSTYTFSGYRTDGAQGQERQLAWAELTFLPETDVSGAIAVSPNTTVSVTGQTVRVTFAPRVPAVTEFEIVVGNVANPALAGTYSVGDITCQTTNNGGRQQRLESIPTAEYAIVDVGYLSLTVSAPDPGNTVDFGVVEPGIETAPRSVVVTVQSSESYTVARTLDGDGEQMGLSVDGLPEEPQPAGLGVFTDSLVLDPPWTSEPEVPYSATITYSAVQN